MTPEMSAFSVPMYSFVPSLLRASPCGDAEVFGGLAGAPLRPARRGCGERLKYSLSMRPFSLNVVASMISTNAAAGSDAKIVDPSPVIAASCG